MTFGAAVVCPQHLDMPFLARSQPGHMGNREFFVDIIVDEEIDSDVRVLDNRGSAEKTEAPPPV